MSDHDSQGSSIQSDLIGFRRRMCPIHGGRLCVLLWWGIGNSDSFNILLQRYFGQSPHMTVTRHILMDEERTFVGQMENFYPGLLRKFPIAPYVAELQNNNPLFPYDPLSASLIGILDRIKSEFGSESIPLYHKISLCRLMRDFLANSHNDTLPPSVQQLYGLWFERVTQDFRTQPDSYYDIDRPLWPLRKDISVCSGRSIPVGGALVVERKLIARRTLIRRAKQRQLKNNPEATQDFRTARTNPVDILTRLRNNPIARGIVQGVRRVLGGYDLCYVIHTVERDIHDFNAEQMNVAYRNIAKLLESDEHVWGVYRISWFLDPAVGDISPDMDFLASVPLNNGAEFHNGGPCSDEDIRKATMLSPDRSRLYESGEYTPSKYFYFWPRKRIIEAFSEAK